MLSRWIERGIQLFERPEKKYYQLRQFIGGNFHQDLNIEDHYDEDISVLVKNIIDYSFHFNEYRSIGIKSVLNELNDYLDNNPVFTEYNRRFLGFEEQPDGISCRDLLVLIGRTMTEALNEHE